MNYLEMMENPKFLFQYFYHSGIDSWDDFFDFEALFNWKLNTGPIKDYVETCNLHNARTDSESLSYSKKTIFFKSSSEHLNWLLIYLFIQTETFDSLVMVLLFEEEDTSILTVRLAPKWVGKTGFIFIVDWYLELKSSHVNLKDYYSGIRSVTLDSNHHFWVKFVGLVSDE